MPYEELKKIAEVLHTIYCQKEHEQDMMLISKTNKCTYYLENSIENSWELDAHREWISHAQALVSIADPIDASEILQDIVRIYQIVQQLKEINPKLIEYIKILIT